ncbi:MAG: phosphodiester glycosidase family protein [Limisphaerales bacterium]
MPSKASRQNDVNSYGAGVLAAGKAVCSLLVALMLQTPGASVAAALACPQDQSLAYVNDVDPRAPMSVHIIRVKRSATDVLFCTTSGKGDVLGMDNVAEQLKTVPADLGQVVAAINGDFYYKTKGYEGRPRDVQIRRGEVVSSPSGHTSFWIDPRGQPRMTNISSLFRVVWPDGKTTPIGLNQYRTNDAAVLFTAAVGRSTRAGGGLEYILEPAAAKGPWLPLRAGQVYEARVREVNNAGHSPLGPRTMVLSVGPKLVPALAPVAPGALVKVITETFPDLSGVDAAIGGGPALVHAGKIMQWKDPVQVRHPRTAIGWNDDDILLVVVDGRQMDVSIGMTLPELAQYMLKLGCKEAMNFDGGGSTTLWAFGAVKNSPSEGQERPASNALVVLKKKAGAQPKTPAP